MEGGGCRLDCVFILGKGGKGDLGGGWRSATIGMDWAVVGVVFFGAGNGVLGRGVIFPFAEGSSRKFK